MHIKQFETLLLRNFQHGQKIKYELNFSLINFYFILTLLGKVKLNQSFFAEMSVLPVSVKIALNML